MKYLVGDRVGVVRADQQLARWCYEDNLCVRDNRRGWKPKGPNRHHKIKIGGSLEAKIEEHLIQSITPGMRLVCQKKRRLREEKRRATKEEITKLLQAWFLREDPYPLPSIDSLVDRASGYRLLSFMNAYLGYNKIKMHPSDESKTTFITDEEVWNQPFRMGQNPKESPKAGPRPTKESSQDPIKPETATPKSQPKTGPRPLRSRLRLNQIRD
ncbi:hypothetical protein CR513_06698, partial [Mucuna pruriens]